ncbi:Acyl-CoA thioesterase FadM [Salinihabitans flavidus]|uniref:Acyl-CoA thioesterase FadM n=1 Tax=Salinihabitans flavidus TaxID=569882 RepID=A0A1H8QY77_9RHOB|nr:acyl-CoA thioesterase [Salinihabitans flavidus]SEO59172.1 Acyl-CoA thioesterase FadM [Salinihabitans flavidus]
MYPFVRMFHQLWRHRRDPPLPLTGVHVSHHRCWPWDIDMWVELNNGRTLTLYDLGRIPLARRVGLIAALRANRWGLTMAGVSVRYRRRIRTFERVTMTSRALCWDARFIYLEQAMWKADGACANHALYRSAVTGPGGLVPPATVLAAMGQPEASPPMPDWVQAWVAAEATRPWPPEMS